MSEKLTTQELRESEPGITEKTNPRPGPRDLGLVALGGAAGSLLRYGFDIFLPFDGDIAWSVLVVNVCGAFLLGALITILTLNGPDRGPRRDLRLLLGTGLLGGYTTYSMLALDVSASLLQGHILTAVGYAMATLVLGALAGWGGIVAAQWWRSRR
ncbi:fluoride efflux transporter FluC [Natronoglycomyces albus]|uniref:Fluoride-specific ion channel FluC n=1 Tax=Natronoglycomyces albus TaxID=2811108 RepID=A0A895XSX7_9ACTN|nr:CrcB family protein [Natronoglycomyces albus]QSB05646.1 CrcB family protein [Natronoglycomyces albus]